MRNAFLFKNTFLHIGALNLNAEVYQSRKQIDEIFKKQNISSRQTYRKTQMYKTQAVRLCSALGRVNFCLKMLIR